MWLKPIVRPTAMYYVPFFFILSGYLLKTELPLRLFIRKKIKTLLIPYFFFSLLFVFLDWNVFRYSSFFYDSIVRVFVEGLSSEKSTPLWFVIVLFTCSLVGYTILKKSNWVCCLGGALFLSIIAYLLSVFNIHLPYLLHVVPSATIFYICGYYIARFLDLKGKGLKLLVLIISCVICVMGPIDLGDMHLNQIESYPMFFIKPILTAYVVIFIMYSFERCFVNPITALPRYIARNGLVVLAFHCYLVFLFQVAISQLRVQVEDNTLFILKFVFVFSSLWGICVPFCNRYLYKILGKDKLGWFNSCRV